MGKSVNKVDSVAVSAESLVKRGLALLNSDVGSAEEILATADRLGDPSGLAAYTLGQLARERKNPAAAKKWFRSALKKTPDLNVVMFLLAQAHHQLGEARQAKALLRQLLKAYPAHEGGRKLFALIEAEGG